MVIDDSDREELERLVKESEEVKLHKDMIEKKRELKAEIRESKRVIREDKHPNAVAAGRVLKIVGRGFLRFVDDVTAPKKKDKKD